MSRLVIQPLKKNSNEDGNPVHEIVGNLLLLVSHCQIWQFLLPGEMLRESLETSVKMNK